MFGDWTEAVALSAVSTRNCTDTIITHDYHCLCHGCSWLSLSNWYIAVVYMYMIHVHDRWCQIMPCWCVAVDRKRSDDVRMRRWWRQDAVMKLYDASCRTSSWRCLLKILSAVLWFVLIHLVHMLLRITCYFFCMSVLHCVLKTGPQKEVGITSSKKPLCEWFFSECISQHLISDRPIALEKLNMGQVPRVVSMATIAP